MNIIIKSQGTLAIYEQIVNQMKNSIVSGELAAGEALPSIRALASELQVMSSLPSAHMRSWRKKG